MVDKPLLFISHITEEKELAQAFKEMVEHAFLGMIEVFVSSDAESIPMGKRWLEEVSDALNRCKVEIVVCSPHSVTRPWIQFEAGAGWIRGIDVIPICHTGMVPSKLPVPLNMLQGATATDVVGIANVVPVLAKALGSKTPVADVVGFVAKAEALEKQYLSRATPAALASGPSSVDLISNPDDCLVLLEWWLNSRPDGFFPRAIRYADVDAELKLVSGSTKKFIEEAAIESSYFVRRKGEEVILLGIDIPF